MFSCVYKDYVWPADSFTNFTVEPHFRVLEQKSSTVYSFQGVEIEEFHCIQRCPYFRVLE